MILPRNSRKSGFTLIELLVVLTILGIILAMIPSSLGMILPRYRLQAAARDITAACRAAHSTALASGDAVIIDLDRLVLPSGAIISVETINKNTDHLVHFYSDGSASGAKITLTLGTRTSRILVDWLTGNVILDAAS